jgi:hypothetical protein
VIPAAARRVVFDRLGYVPFAEQLAIHEDESALKLIAGGERGAKSWTTGKELIGDSAFLELVWIVGPDYRQAKPEFRYLVEDAIALDAIEHLSDPVDDESPRTLVLHGGIKITTRSGRDPAKLASEAPDEIAMVEAAQQPYENFQKLWNRLAQKRRAGRGKLILSGTFEGSLGWYPEMWTKLQGPNEYGGKSFSLPTWANRALFPGGWDDPQIQLLRATNPEDLFWERFGGVPRPPKELVFREFLHTVHVTPMRFVAGIESAFRDDRGWALPDSGELELWVDPGYAGAYAVLFVYVEGGLVWTPDEVYLQGVTGPDVITRVMGKTELFERVRRVIIDVAGRQHNAMESQVELWERTTRLPVFSRPVGIVDGINRHRTFLVDPLTKAPRLFHDPRCRGAIREYGLYRYHEAKELRDENELPIDANNHAMKAIAYGLTHRFGVVDRLSKPTRRNLIRDRYAKRPLRRAA